MRLKSDPRPGATMVELAIVCSVTFLLLFGVVIGGLGVFRYQQLSWLARDATRYASVRGAQYQEETGKPAATAEDVYRDVIKAKATAIELDQLQYTVTWDRDNRPYRTSVVNGRVEAVVNTVTVTLTYRWIPEAFLGGVTMHSSSTLPVTY